MRNQLDLQKTSTCQKKSHENNYFLKEEAHDHRKATKLVMSLQSSEIKLVGAILLRVLTLKKKTKFNANRVTGDPKLSRESLKKSAFYHLGIVTDPKRRLQTKK